MHEVDIWRIDLSGQRDQFAKRHCLLSRDEVQRSERFNFEGDRRRFTVARAAMREILGRYAGLEAKDLCFSYGPKGKPELAFGVERSGIKFNLSHSSELALLAVTQGLTVGVDIECLKPDCATDDLAERFFSTFEMQTLQSLPPGQRAEAFFSCWTRKEAYIKALGEGLSVSLKSFAVAFAPGCPAALLHVNVDPKEVERWSMYNIEVGGGYKAALVVEGKNHRLKQIEWTPAAAPAPQMRDRDSQANG